VGQGLGELNWGTDLGQGGSVDEVKDVEAGKEVQDRRCGGWCEGHTYGAWFFGGKFPTWGTMYRGPT
jgi:hypothetical protein